MYCHLQPQVQPQVDKLGIFQFTSSCPEDATFDLLKGFSNPEQVVNTRPSVTRPGRPKLFVLSNVPRTLVRNLWQDETHWKPRTFLVKLAAWFELPTSKVAEIHWFWWFCPRCASMAMSSDFWPLVPISHTAPVSFVRCTASSCFPRRYWGGSWCGTPKVSTNKKHQTAGLVTIVHLLHFNVFHVYIYIIHAFTILVLFWFPHDPHKT